MLKDANINAYPVLIRLRDRGKLPYTYPSLDKLNTFIIGISTVNSQTIYLDGSIEKGDINILPPCLMVDRGRIYNKSGDEAWIDLSKAGKNIIKCVTQANIDPSGVMSGQRPIL